MKKYSIYALMSAIALAGSVGFSGCSSSDDVINNPDYNPETNSVKTEFAISLPNYVGASTRQTTAITQAQTPATFRGMQDMVLIPFKEFDFDDNNSPLNSKVFTLEPISNFMKATQKAMVYKTLDVPINTDRFIFYGQATVDGSDFENGKLNAPDYAAASGTDDYNFTMEQILTDYDPADDVRGKAICAYLKSIRETPDITSGLLQTLLTNFKPTAASSKSIEAAVQQLWDLVKVYSESDGKNLVKSKIQGSGNSTATFDGDVVTLTGSDITGYPANLGLPDGAVTISWNATTNEPELNNSAAVMNIAELTDYVYPAALYYRANSTIGVSNNEDVSENYANNPWSTIAEGDLYSWNGAVSKTTRSIALHDQIQYAVGRLDLSIMAGASPLYDGNGDPVTVVSAGFPVSAVLVGGQKNVGYDFTPNGNHSYTIYDKTKEGTVAAKNGTAEGVFRTLVLETASKDDVPAAATVNVAVELTNNSGAAFRGKDGTIPAGGKFYLVGALNLNGTGITQPASGARTKVFEQDYVTTAIFTIIQGDEGAHNDTGLGAAYNVLPDLTVSQLEVAFSVDLTWTPGIKFEVNL